MAVIDSESGDSTSVSIQQNVNDRDASKKVKIDGSQTRWIIITLVMYYFLAEGFTKTCFGQVNNIVARFFDVSLEYVDWLTLAPAASSAVSLFFMTWMAASGLVGLRRWCLTSAGFITLSFAFTVTGVLGRHLFPLAVLGQILAGTVHAINFSLAPLMASSWFPEKEQPTAIALTYAGLNAGNIVGLLIPANVVPKTNDTNGTMMSLTIDGEIEWDEKISMALTAIFSSFLAASLVFGFFSFLFIFDAPSPMQLPDNQTVVEEERYQMRKKKRKESAFQIRINKARSATKGTIAVWVQSSKNLLTMRKFMVLAIPYGILMPLCLIWFVLMSDMLRSTRFETVIFLDISAENISTSNALFKTSSNVMAGYAVSLYCVGGLISGAFTGKVAQLFNFHYARISCGATWGVVMASVGIFVGFSVGSIECIFVFTLIFGLFVPVAATALVALVIERVTSEDRLTVGTWLAIFSSANASLLPLFGRIFFENFGPSSICIFQITLATVLAIFLIFVGRFLQ
uniref:feline leukemia virus subgroup C receptor-related protein 1-like n=1 Tax=Styela clava TaxID=7725 RepID=UPI0019396A12|nr:feline leukemia virus subgroup C receptor-related protein 1-like [Styela clava]